MACSFQAGFQVVPKEPATILLSICLVPWEEAPTAQLPEHSSPALPTPHHQPEEPHCSTPGQGQAIRTKWKGMGASLKPYSPLKKSCVWEKVMGTQKNSPSALRPQAPAP